MNKNDEHPYAEFVDLENPFWVAAARIYQEQEDAVDSDDSEWLELRAAINPLNAFFEGAYKAASGEREALIKGMTDYIVEIAKRTIPGNEGAVCYAEAIGAHSRTLRETIERVSGVPASTLVPEDFHTRLSKAYSDARWAIGIDPVSDRGLGFDGVIDLLIKIDETARMFIPPRTPREPAEKITAASEKKLVASFQKAVGRVREEEHSASFSTAATKLGDHFSIVYGLAEDIKTKKALIRTLTNFVLEVTDVIPCESDEARALGSAVEALCNALDETVKDRSFIPARFSARLSAASGELSGLYERSRNFAVKEEAGKISAAANKFRSAPTP